jgi:hypothetical protein
VCFSVILCFLSRLVWFFLWLPEEVLALLFLLHRQNGDFSILMKDILYTFTKVKDATPVVICWQLMLSFFLNTVTAMGFLIQIIFYGHRTASYGMLFEDAARPYNGQDGQVGS